MSSEKKEELFGSLSRQLLIKTSSFYSNQMEVFADLDSCTSCHLSNNLSSIVRALLEIVSLLFQNQCRKIQTCIVLHRQAGHQHQPCFHDIWTSTDHNSLSTLTTNTEQHQEIREPFLSLKTCMLWDSVMTNLIYSSYL